MGPLLKKRGLGCDVLSRLRLGLGPTWNPREARCDILSQCHYVTLTIKNTGRDTLSH